MENLISEINAITLNVVEELDPTFYNLKSSYKGLKIFELFVEIIKLRGQSTKDLISAEDNSITKDNFIAVLKSSTVMTDDIKQIIAESFYLGMICSSLIYANIPIPNSLFKFGKIIDEEFASVD